MQPIEYKILTKDKLAEIKPLWEELNLIHLEDSVYFKEHYAAFSFEKRSAGWLNMPEEHFHLLIAATKESGPVGYCVSTINTTGKGEIDSLFVCASFRQQGIGKTLTEKNLEWLLENRCNPIRLTVSYGHESVFGFYQRLGFYPRLTTLEWKESNSLPY
jgi:ribosomal protein S18 acetylase RimI-like enzyme